MDSDRQVWEPGLDQGSTQTLHSERHGPLEPEDCLANVAFTPTRSSHSCPGWGKRGLVELRAAALGLLGFCCKPRPPFPGAPPERMGPAGHRAKERAPPPPAGAQGHRWAGCRGGAGCSAPRKFCNLSLSPPPA